MTSPMHSIRHISYCFWERLMFSTRLQWWKVWDVCYFTETRGKILKTILFWKWGAGPKGPRKRAALAPHFSKQNCFQNFAPCFCEITNISYLPLLKLRAKSESFSKIVWNGTNWIRERSHRRTELSRTTPSILWLAIYPCFLRKESDAEVISSKQFKDLSKPHKQLSNSCSSILNADLVCCRCGTDITDGPSN